MENCPYFHQLLSTSVHRENQSASLYLVGMAAVVEFVLALVKQEAHERAGRVRGVEVGRALRQTLA